MQKTFYHHMNGKRPITVRIDGDWITFHFKNEDNREFYSIPVNDWIRDKNERLGRPDNWHHHMMEKTWFNIEMKNFIDSYGKS